jgi:hypothetical protein
MDAVGTSDLLGKPDVGGNPHPSWCRCGVRRARPAALMRCRADFQNRAGAGPAAVGASRALSLARVGPTTPTRARGCLRPSRVRIGFPSTASGSPLNDCYRRPGNGYTARSRPTVAVARSGRSEAWPRHGSGPGRAAPARPGPPPPGPPRSPDRSPSGRGRSRLTISRGAPARVRPGPVDRKPGRPDRSPARPGWAGRRPRAVGPGPRAPGPVMTSRTGPTILRSRD